jgi:hypothetical protein
LLFDPRAPRRSVRCAAVAVCACNAIRPARAAPKRPPPAFISKIAVASTVALHCKIIARFCVKNLSDTPQKTALFVEICKKLTKNKKAARF